MKLRTLLSKFLLISALLGLIAAPFAQNSFAAGPMPGPASMKMSSMQASDGMPCCHDEAPAKDCQKSCPLMAMCANQTLLELTGWHVSVRMQLIAFVRPVSDAPVNGIGGSPPARPPKSIA